MKNIASKILVIILAVFCSASVFAQSLSDYIDVVYLKNGSMIKGIIVEQVPGKSLKIETSDGSQFVYMISEVEKFTRELKPVAASTGSTSTMPMMKRVPKAFYSKQKGYFSGMELLIAGSPGLRVIHGYKFGRLGYLGVAVGIEANNTYSNRDYNNIQPLYSSYVPSFIGNMWGNHSPFLTFNLVYAGDIIKRKVTPFYQVELGYGLNLNRRSDQYSSYYDGTGNYYEFQYQRKNRGGPMGGVVFGLKMFTSKKVNFKLGLSARWFTNIYSANVPTSVNFAPYASSSGVDLGGSVGLRFGIGF